MIGMDLFSGIGLLTAFSQIKAKEDELAQPWLGLSGEILGGKNLQNRRHLLLVSTISTPPANSILKKGNT